MTWDTPEGPRVVTGSEARLLKHALAAMVDTYELDQQAGCDPAEYGITLFDELTWDDRLGLLDQVGQALFFAQPQPPTQSAVLDAAVAALFNQILHEIEYEIELSGVGSESRHMFWRKIVAQAFCDAFHPNSDGCSNAEDCNQDVTGKQRIAPDPMPGWLYDGIMPSDNLTEDAEDCSCGNPECENNVFYDDAFNDSGLDDGLDDDVDGDGTQSWISEVDLGDDDHEDSSSTDWISIYDAPPMADCNDVDVWYDVIDALTDRILADRDFDLADRFLDAPPSLAEELRATLGIAADYFVTPAPIPRESPARLAAKIRQLVGVTK